MNTYEKGLSGENDGATYLQSKGFKIIERNFRSRRGEIDIIAVKDDVLVFVEVKSWKRFDSENIEKVLDMGKRRRIITTARFFLATHPTYESCAVRFDVLLIRPDSAVFEHIPDAFTES